MPRRNRNKHTQYSHLLFDKKGLRVQVGDRLKGSCTGRLYEVLPPEDAKRWAEEKGQSLYECRGVDSRSSRSHPQNCYLTGDVALMRAREKEREEANA